MIPMTKMEQSLLTRVWFVVVDGNQTLQVVVTIGWFHCHLHLEPGNGQQADGKDEEPESKEVLVKILLLERHDARLAVRTVKMNV